MGMRILVIGSGGREHAVVASLHRSPLVEKVFVAPGNGGTAPIAENVAIRPPDEHSVAAWAAEHGCNLVVIGPEAPLVAGLADAVRAVGIPAFGPGADGARVEGSKSFAKALMLRHHIPTGAAASFAERASALSYLDEIGAPVVVKADGLAAGKGVFVATTLEEARVGVEACFSGQFGDAGSTVLIEEYLQGPEVSLLAFVDGTTVLPMAPAQDHKRAFEGDRGPNTGGMGVYSPVPIVYSSEYVRMLEILEATACALAEEGVEYRGVLYGGFILTEDGPKVLEFNARFGDPETQVILPRLETDLAEVLLATAEGRLDRVELSWSSRWAVSVVLASGGYPGDYTMGKPITGIEGAEALEGVTVYHAGTRRRDDGVLVTAGGRVLNVTALGADFGSARDKAYEAVREIGFDGMFYRSDIGARALAGRAAWGA